MAREIGLEALRDYEWEVCLAVILKKINDLRFFLLRRNQQFSTIPKGGQRRLTWFLDVLILA